MASTPVRRALRAAVGCVLRPATVFRPMLAAAVCAIALAGCNQDPQMVSAAQPRGATVAFDSIDGLPPAQFHELVQSLNDEAHSRQLAVISREKPSAYRVRGYLAAEVENGKTTISWVWDVFDRSQRRALRIAGAESIKGTEAWKAANDVMLRRIAHGSMDKLSAFLTSPAIVPGTPDTMENTRMALAAPLPSSPEAAGIFRIGPPHADPAATGDAASPTTAEDAAVPLPRPRPAAPIAILPHKTLALATFHDH